MGGRKPLVSANATPLGESTSETMRGYMIKVTPPMPRTSPITFPVVSRSPSSAWANKATRSGFKLAKTEINPAETVSRATKVKPRYKVLLKAPKRMSSAMSRHDGMPARAIPQATSSMAGPAIRKRTVAKVSGGADASPILVAINAELQMMQNTTARAATVKSDKGRCNVSAFKGGDRQSQPRRLCRQACH